MLSLTKLNGFEGIPMDAIKFNLRANYGHLKKPETNNNPLTYSVLHKTALIGFIGAVCGIDRKKMKDLFPLCSEDLLYSISLKSPLIKESYAYTKRKVVRGNFYAPDRRYCEYLKNPSYSIIVACKKDANDRVKDLMVTFIEHLLNNRSGYPTYIGVSACPAEYSNVNLCTVSDMEEQGVFSTEYVFSNEHEIKSSNEIPLIYDRIPTYQTNDFFNPPEHFKTVVITEDHSLVPIEGNFYKVSTGEQAWFM